MSRTERIHVRLSVEDRELVERLAAADNRTKSDWVRIAIKMRINYERKRRDRIQAQARARRDSEPEVIRDGKGRFQRDGKLD